jgi:radical SAM superfamily enzyme YgiQ (UPF0313 family)
MNTWDIRSEIRRRLAEEWGTLAKQAPFRVALCYPSPYPVGMSSLGFQAIYRQINVHKDASAQRVFLPDDVQGHRAARTPLISYEGETPLAEFDAVAFSVSYELEITGVFEILDLGGIPPLRADRNASHPPVIIGGPLTNSNPEPLAPFADLIVLGEGEQVIHAVLDAGTTMPRSEFLSYCAGIPGCFVPGLSGELPAIAKTPAELLPAHSQIIARDTVLSGMFLIEPERGCSRGCTYCVMRRTTNGGMRLVSPETVLQLIPEQARRVGLVGAAVTDHPRIKEIVRGIVDAGKEVGISSLRADRLDEEFVTLLARGGYRTLTTASDGASERLRRLIDRKTSETHLTRAAELVRKCGLQRLKLYEMIGLPGETDSDIDELARFSTELSRIVPLSLGISPFVAKRNTPLDGAPFEAVPSQEAKLSRLRAALKGRVEIRPTSPRWAWVEYMLSQGGPEAGLAALDAWRAGGSFGAWKKAFKTRQVRPFAKRRVPDGRRNAPQLV